jgi:hypothetical protein
MIGVVVAIGIALAMAWLLIAFIDGCNVRKIERDLEHRLRPYAGTPQARYMDKDELWKAIRGVRGVLVLYWAAGAIATLASREAAKNPARLDAARMIFFDALELRCIAVFALLEAVACVMSPHFPRALAATLVRLYCDLGCKLDALEAIGSA